MAMALAKACADLRGGEVLDLDLHGTTLSDDGARQLAAALALNRSLMELNLSVCLLQRWDGRGTDV